MRCFLLLLFLSIHFFAGAQYYYNDILTTRQTNKQYRLLKDNNIQQVTAKSFEADGTMSDGFILSQQLSENSTVLTTVTANISSGKTTSVSSYNNNRIKKTENTSEKIKSTTTYAYNNNDLTSITSVTEDAFMNSKTTQVHQWSYDNGTPVKMLLIKDNTDTTTVDFVKDETGNIAEEHWYRNGRKTETYFYYYNAQHNLTDIVRYNLKAKRLLPDFLFEYDSRGMLTQYIQVPQSSGDYLVWKYLYNANGLKEKELCFTKSKQPVGRVEYSYK